MKKKEFKDRLFELLTEGIEELTTDQVIQKTKLLIFEYEKKQKYVTENKGRAWSDEELRIVLSFAPTKENILKLAKGFKRSYGSIEQIFRWAVTTQEVITNKGREDDSFIQQIKRIYKETGWKA
ncbi:MAG: hypothetical protein NAG76_18485 [Candidatus Pristimantibacillus lignocellulolyticus]|uniref:Uncharacterized protein n=1 Tax=Candidatus Pristimantibacillus lignocellulolyticus TaxID=2994561 RepID=A0A9J6ZCG1_9BACL|nr:MAG: hypothetical protein NAG76_18485 [Candidatus Pristimantibacillus lignocellulolyticus]